jgi:hypothetical protein
MRLLIAICVMAIGRLAFGQDCRCGAVQSPIDTRCGTYLNGQPIYVPPVGAFNPSGWSVSAPAYYGPYGSPSIFTSGSAYYGAAPISSRGYGFSVSRSR